MMVLILLFTSTYMPFHAASIPHNSNKPSQQKHASGFHSFNKITTTTTSAASIQNIRGGVTFTNNNNFYRSNTSPLVNDFPQQQQQQQQPREYLSSPPSTPSPLTLTDLDEPSYFYPSQQPAVMFEQTTTMTYDDDGCTRNKKKTIGSLLTQWKRQLVSYAQTIHATSPTLSLTSGACIVVFLMWQVLPNRFLQQHFTCSRQNVLERGHWHALILSAISHSSPLHLLTNLYVFINLGSIMVKDCNVFRNQQQQQQSEWPLLSLIIGSALFGSLTFLIRNSNSSCLGLSSVTMALLALQAKWKPQSEYTLFLTTILPFRFKAQTALAVLLIWSVIGSIHNNNNNNGLVTHGGGGGGGVAHAAHLGGLLFGMAYFELWDRRFTIRHYLSKYCHRLFGGRINNNKNVNNNKNENPLNAFINFWFPKAKQ